MRYTTIETELLSYSKKILSSYYKENSLTFLLSLLAPNAQFIGTGKQGIIIGREAIGQFLKMALTHIAPCVLNKEKYTVQQLDAQCWMCLAESEIMMAPGHSMALQDNQRTVFIYRRKAVNSPPPQWEIVFWGHAIGHGALQQPFHFYRNWDFDTPSLAFLYYQSLGDLSHLLQQAWKFKARNTTPFYHREWTLSILFAAEGLYLQGYGQDASDLLDTLTDQEDNEEQLLIYLCIDFLQGRIALSKGNWKTMMHSLNHAKDIAQRSDNSLYKYMYDTIAAFLLGELGHTGMVQTYIHSGKIPETATSSNYPFFYVVYDKILLIRKEYLQLESIIKYHCQVAEQCHCQLAKIYLTIFAAILQLKLFHKEKGLQILQQALEIAISDQCIMPFAENHDLLDIPLRQLKQSGIHPSFIDTILEASQAFPSNGYQQVIRHHSRWTKREYEIAQLIVQSMTNRDIATHLGIAESTVKNLVSRMYKKFGLKNRAELIHMFIKEENNHL